MSLWRLGAAIGVAGGLALPWAAMAESPRPDVVFAIEPARIELGTQPISATIVVRNAPETVGFQFDLAYDPARVAITKVELGPYVGSTGRPVQPLGPNLGVAGRLALGAMTAGGSAMAAGDGVLALIELAPLAAGTSELSLANAHLVGADAEPIPVRVEGASAVAQAEPGEREREAVANLSATLQAAPPSTLAADFVAAVAQEATAESPAKASAAAATAMAPRGTPAESDSSPIPMPAGGQPSNLWVALLALAVLIVGVGWLFGRQSSS